MKLAVSNIAWDDDEEDAILDLLNAAGARGVEIAPTKVWPEWRGADEAAATKKAAQLAARGFAVPALQAILYGRPELSIFAESDLRRQALEHLEQVARLAAALGARCLVFGSPRNRDPGALGATAAFDVARAFFADAARRCGRFGVSLCLEVAPGAYGRAFGDSWRAVRDLVDAVDHPAFGLHFDTGCAAAAGDDALAALTADGHRIRHVHISEPGLQGFDSPVLDHPSIAHALAASGYQGWLSIEMRRASSPRESIGVALEYVRSTYLAASSQQTKQRPAAFKQQVRTS